MKHCNRCEIDLPRESFYKLKNGNGHRLSAYCRKCSTQYKVEWKAKNPDKAKLINKKTTLKNRYGISLEKFEEMLSLQNNACAICSKTISEPGDSYVDHCHNTGKIRKILCINCNSGLGQFKDSPEILKKAYEYLLTNG